MKSHLGIGSLPWALLARTAALSTACAVLAETMLTRPALPPLEILSPSSRAVPAPVGVQSARPEVPLDPTIALHPLFYPTRSPWVPPPSKAALPVAHVTTPPARPVRPPPSNYTLAGTIMSGDVRRALLRQPGNGRGLEVGEGEVLDGWTIREITRGHLIFELNGTVFELTFPSAAGSEPGRKTVP